MAVAISWKGFVDTDLKFSEFFSANHTIICRFMQQYPNAYEGPMIAEKGSGTFLIGQGDYELWSGQNLLLDRRILIAVGSKSRLFTVPALKAGVWGHLAAVGAVTADKINYVVYLNGELLGSLAVPASDTDLPSGTLRFGKRTTGRTFKGHNAQFYGLLDDVGVFTRALSQDELRNLNNNVKNLTGNESGLLAGYTFAESPSHPRLSRPIVLKGAAYRVNASLDRNSAADVALLPLPTKHQPMDLPFKVGDAWRVVKGHDTDQDHHSGHSSFALDFIIDAEKKLGDLYPNGTGGAPLYAAAGGSAARVHESEPAGTVTANVLEVEQAPNEFAMYMHLGQNSVPVNLNEVAVQGQQIGIAGSTGLKDCTVCNHLHFGVHDHAGETAGFVTLPVAYSDYQVRNGSGWINVPRGIPTTGQVVRNPPAPVFGPPTLRPSSAVARTPHSLDLVVTDMSGQVWTTRWRPNAFAERWDRWRPVLSKVGLTHVSAEVVSRDPKKLDIFLTGSDLIPYTGAWEEDFNSSQWMGWWSLTGLPVALPHHYAPITAVARHPDLMDIFTVGGDGGIYTASWDRNRVNGWAGWWRIGSITAKPGSRVSAVSRGTHKLDIFVAGSDGKVYTAAWDADVSQQWMGWWTILNADVPPGAHVTAISRHPNKLDVFVVASNEGAFTAAWEGGVNNNQWAGWWRIGDAVFKPGIPITPLCRDENKLDLFVAGNDLHVWTAAWALGARNNQWVGWWPILDGKIAAGSAVAAVSRDPGKLDIFAVDPDGGLYTAAWDQDVAVSPWRGWWRIGS